MPNTDELRDLLSDRAEMASTARPPVDAAIRRGRRVRARRRLAVGAGALAVVAAVAVPTMIGSPSQDPAPPAGQTPAPTVLGLDLPPGGGWVEAVPGLDLPQGPALDTPYANGAELHVDSKTHGWTGEITQIIDVPEGLVVLSLVGERPPRGSGAPGLQSRLELLVDDATSAQRLELDVGHLDAVDAARLPDGTTRVVWTWRASDEAVATEVRTVLLSTGDPMTRLSWASALEVAGFVGGDVLLKAPSDVEPAALLRWALGAEIAVPVSAEPGDGSFLLSAGDGPNSALALWFSLDSPQCTYAAPLERPTAREWEHCEEGPLVRSPHGTLGANQSAVVDLATGGVVAELGLPGMPAWNDPESPVRVDVVGWSGEDVLLHVSYAGTQHTTPSGEGSWITTPVYVGVRCAATTGACERIPHAVDVVAGTGSNIVTS